MGHIDQYGTRQVEDYDIFFGTKTWNKIPIAIKRSTSVQIFRQKLKSFLLENYQQRSFVLVSINFYLKESTDVNLTSNQLVIKRP